MTMMILVATAVAACRNMPWTMKFAAVTSCQTTTLAMVELAQPWARGQAAKLQVAEKASAALDRSHFDFLLGHGLSLSGIGSARLQPARRTNSLHAPGACQHDGHDDDDVEVEGGAQVARNATRGAEQAGQHAPGPGRSGLYSRR